MTSPGREGTPATEAADDLRARLQRGISWNLLAVASSQGSTFLVGILVARVLGQVAFGQYAIIQSTLSTLAAMAQVSMGYTATKYVAEFRSTDARKAGRILGLCLVVTVAVALMVTLLLIVGAPTIAGKMLASPGLTTTLMVGSGYLFFSSVNGLQMGALSGLESYKDLAKAGGASGVFALICIPTGAWYFGTTGAVLGLSVASLLGFVYLGYCLRTALIARGIRIRFDALAAEREIIYRFALPAAASGYVSLPAIWLANTTLVRRPDGYVQMALYGAASNIRALAVSGSNIINNVTLSILNHVKGSGDAKRYAHVWKVNLALITMTGLTLAILLGLLSKFILQAFGKDFIAGQPVVWVLMMTAVVEAVSIAAYQVIQSTGKLWISFFGIVLPRDGLFLLLAYVLVPAHGAIGLAWSAFGAYCVSMLTTASIAALLWKRNVLISGEGSLQ